MFAGTGKTRLLEGGDAPVPTAAVGEASYGIVYHAIDALFELLHAKQTATGTAIGWLLVNTWLHTM